MEQPISKQEDSLKRPLKFLFKWRSFTYYELICYVFMYAGTMMFAYGIQPYTTLILKQIFLTIATLYSGFFAALIWNDITDKDIDVVVHPTRPIPDKRISQSKFFIIALVFSALTFFFALLISPWCLLLVGITALFVTFHNKYLKKKIKFPAYSEIFTPVQWLTVPLFGFFAIWSTTSLAGNINITLPLFGFLSINKAHLLPMFLLVFFSYFADDAHDLAEGIHDVEGDRLNGVKTYATSFGEKIAAKISFLMIFISGVIGILLSLMTLLSLLFLVPFLLLWFYTLYHSFKFIKIADDLQRRQQAKIIGKKQYDFLLFSYTLIFVDILVQLINPFYQHLASVII
jgi:geranylgeranylglycerol-phosphate geranylgeranyltransferase